MGSKTVLLVDDSLVARMLARAVVEKLHPDWTVVEAGNGEDAIRIARATPPDFLLVDVTMPGMNGLEAAAILKRDHPAAAITMVTANIQDPVRDRAAALGVGFIAKPVSEAALRPFLDGAPTTATVPQ